MDSIYLLTIIRYYLSESYDHDLTSISKVYCKIYYYISYSLSTISPMMLVFISAERIASIKFPSKKYIFYTFKYQIIYFLAILAFNVVLYIQVYSLKFDFINQN